MQMVSKPKDYAFKKTFSDKIPPINFLTHNLYSYPAKFIPHVPFYTISKYLKNDNSIVLDPFAGSSSTAIEALRLGHNCICIDINPLTNFLTEVKTQKINFELNEDFSEKIEPYTIPEDKVTQEFDLVKYDLRNFMTKLKHNETLFFPTWSNIDHWYPEEFKQVLAGVWGFIYSYENQFTREFQNLVKLSALYLSRYLSYGARDVPKLFKSKRRIKQIDVLRKKIHKKPELPYKVFQDKLVANFKQMKNLSTALIEKNVSPQYEYILNDETVKSKKEELRKIICLGEVDISSYEFSIEDSFIDLIITSPPYIYAQEYMRSTKLDLYWLNLADDSRIRELTKKELGNKRITDTSIIMNKLRNIGSFLTISRILEKKEKDKYGKNGKYIPAVFNYFYDMYLIIEKLHEKLKSNGIFGLFIGNPTVLGHLVPCHNIFNEIFQDIGFKIVEIGYDQITSPRLLKGRKNESPQGMKAEWLIIAKKINL
ncbi:MAG: DNA methyltransferase [Candidatus Hodarchaeales archaeon]|jgi:DNA modification methylase